MLPIGLCWVAGASLWVKGRAPPPEGGSGVPSFVVEATTRSLLVWIDLAQSSDRKPDRVVEFELHHCGAFDPFFRRAKKGIL